MGSHRKQRKRSESTSEDSEDSDKDIKKKKRSDSSSKKRRSKKRKKVSSSSESSSESSLTPSSSSSDSEQDRKKTKKQKKLKRLQKKPKSEETTMDIPLDLMDKSKAMAPMTKEEWEKRQNVVRRVYDESTGRHRLIKGDGEVIEEIVSRDRHKAINQQATKGDGDYFQACMSKNVKK